MIETLHDTLPEGKATEVLDEIVKGLLDYTDYHFSYEEELFEKYGCLDVGDHKKEHAELHDRVMEHKVLLGERNLFLGDMLLLNSSGNG